MTDWLEYYRKTWTARSVVFDRFLAEEANLARVLGRYDRFEAANRMVVVDGKPWYLPSPEPQTINERLKNVEPGVTCGVAAPVSYYSGFDSSRLFADLAADADIIAEIGCGYGRQLFELWLAGGGSPSTRFLGFEPNEAGRRIGANLARLEPAMNIEFLPGDFETFDESLFLSASRTLILTNYAVMYQVEFPDSFFHKVAKISGDVVMAFVEPLGWQMGEGVPLYDEGHNTDFIRKLAVAAEEGLLDIVYTGANLFGRESNYTRTSVIVAVKPAAAEAGGPSG